MKTSIPLGNYIDLRNCGSDKYHGKISSGLNVELISQFFRKLYEFSQFKSIGVGKTNIFNAIIDKH